MAPALRLDGVSKRYGAVRALDRLSFAVPEGRFFVLFGPSAVGKTTALRTIAGLVVPDAGRLEMFGADVTRAAIASRGVSMVFQSFALYPHLTVYENFAYPLREMKVARDEIDRRVRETAAMLRLSHRLDRKPGTLSGGEQQRVALGRSLIRRPRILLLDEPLTNLDAKLRQEMRTELKRLHAQFGMTIVYATPDELEALSMGEEIAVLREGAVVQRGTPDALYEAPRDLYVASKIGSPTINLVEAVVRRGGEGVETPFGALALRTSAAHAGERAVLGIRPSDLRPAGPDEAALPASVRLIEPLGDVTVVSFALAGEAGPILKVVLPEARALGMKPGDAVPLVLDPGKIHLFHAGTGLAIREPAPA
ncbi:ABC transporter ATP-binding protein [Labrys wisconsinensis]|uniref:ABC-type sugar transport system ATPase subunit n=1 Tax=Labrys wisconsinensis TaxID=425677 RepID=A0ABU0JLV8_9HYPH|nr:ABC transporter ATP-binding protein [Labrys wisconsinensis]MDQ0475281.1 ABC-type sugar transport system ATPase subunit [Labrys wisconsinensis]